MPIMQLGLFGTNYTVKPTCVGCSSVISGEVFTDPDGSPLCINCFNWRKLAVCPNCSNSVAVVDLIENPNGDKWCQDCIESDCFECANCNNIAWNDDRIDVMVRHNYNWDTESICSDCSDDIQPCCDCGEIFYRNEMTVYGDYDYLCERCYNDGYFTCEDCGRVISQDDAHDFSTGGVYCSDCGRYEGDFDPSGFHNRSGSLTIIGSARCYGVELETDNCDGYHNLEDSGAWGAKNDCTVAGKEFYSDILNGDDGLKAIEDWGDLAARNDWDAGSSAGYHLHLDMRNESDDSLYAIAYAYRYTQKVWQSFVHGRRHNGSYSSSPSWGCDDINRAAESGRSFYSFSSCGSRYYWCNIAAYHCHTTFEIRLHQGTCDTNEVINWVKAHTRFADWASSMGLAGVKETFRGMDSNDLFLFIVREIWRDYPLSEYYAEKARHYNHGYLTTSIGCGG